MTITLQSHGLRFEGAPHDEAGNRITRGFGPPGIGGSGRAKCGCGTLSPVLPSAYQRKQWHRAHKADEWAKANGEPRDRAFVLENALREATSDLREATAFIRDETGHWPTVEHLTGRIQTYRTLLDG